MPTPAEANGITVPPGLIGTTAPSQAKKSAAPALCGNHRPRPSTDRCGAISHPSDVPRAGIVSDPVATPPKPASVVPRLHCAAVEACPHASTANTRIAMVASPVTAREQRLQIDVRGVIRCAYERGVPTMTPHITPNVRQAAMATREISRGPAEFFPRQLRARPCRRTVGA